MGLHNELPVYKASYALLMSIFEFSRHFNKEYKYTVGESLKKETIGLLTLIYRANSRPRAIGIGWFKSVLASFNSLDLFFEAKNL